MRKSAMIGAALASVMAIGGMSPLDTSRSSIVPPAVSAPRPAKRHKRKGHFPQAGTGRVRQGKYTGAVLRKLRRERTKKSWDAHIKICKEQGVDPGISKDQLVDLW